jgi:hypothetical protein
MLIKPIGIAAEVAVANRVQMIKMIVAIMTALRALCSACVP